jgi:hypothetical protein
MGNVYKPVEQDTRLAPEYLEARSLLEERRLLQARLTEINRALRTLSRDEFEAVEAARNEIPFRQPHGRPSLSKRLALASVPIATPLVGDGGI